MDSGGSKPITERDIVFISHANPEDNSPTIWLASKLSIAGYRVWSDVTQLLGGEVTWDDIEDAIRNFSAKFIVLVSKNSQTADGVLDEVNVAVSVERNLKLTRFVIPIRLDSLPFDEFRANIARKNAIDFSLNWANGLTQLLERLQKDGVPKKTDSQTPIAKWFAKYSAPAKVDDKPQLHCSNWARIVSIPETLEFSRIPMSFSSAVERVESFSYPSFAHEQFVGSFASSSELQSDLPKWLVLTLGFRIRTKDLLEGNVTSLPSLTFRDGQNMLSGLIRKAWDCEMSKRGLLSYKFSDSSKAWFYPHGFTLNNIAHYVDLDGRTKSKKLVGKSERLQAFWHYSVSAHPHFGRVIRLTLKTHIVFTSDGRSPLPSKDRMHVMRRSFCRSWYNERWRGLLVAYLYYLSNGESIFALQVSPNQRIDVSAIPIGFRSPQSLDESSLEFEVKDDEEFEEVIPDGDALDASDDLDPGIDLDEGPSEINV